MGRGNPAMPPLGPAMAPGSGDAPGPQYSDRACFPACGRTRSLSFAAGRRSDFSALAALGSLSQSTVGLAFGSIGAETGEGECGTAAQAIRKTNRNVGGACAGSGLFAAGWGFFDLP